MVMITDAVGGSTEAEHDPHITVIDALMSTVPPRAYGPYPRWVRQPEGLAQFIASVLIHSRDGLTPGDWPRLVPLCDANGYVTGLPLRIKDKEAAA